MKTFIRAVFLASLIVVGLSGAFASVSDRIPETDPKKADMRTLHQRGHYLFHSGEYAKAIPIFEELMRRYNSIKPDSRSSTDQAYMMRIVAIDELGMAYGITNQLDKAEKTFRYGLSINPNYPLFWYNLACAEAERGNLPAALEHLKKAKDNKRHKFDLDVWPDPRTDSSFTKFYSDGRFKDFFKGGW